MAAPLSVLAWRILWTVEPVGLWSVGSQSQTWEMAAPSVVLPGESRGKRSLSGSSPWGYTESDSTE